WERLQTALARGDRALGDGVVRIHLAYDGDAIALAGDRGSHDFLGAAVAVHFSVVDERHAEIDAETKRGDLGSAVALALAHSPRAEPERRNACAVGQRDHWNRGSRFHRLE